jgi:hypothetical protein
MIRVFRIIIAIMALLGLAIAAEAIAKESGPPPSSAFHTPRTAAEKTLKTILDIDREQPGGFLLMPAGDDPSARNPFDNFTDNFLSAMREKGGKSKKVECRSNNPKKCERENRRAYLINRLSCGAANTKEYGQVFHTLREDKFEAHVMTLWRNAREQPAPAPVYKMVKRGNEWKLDELVCPGR